jgi:hypothetical protein
MPFQILTQEPTYKMTRWTMIKWVFRGIAFLIIALMLSAIITLWSQPNTFNHESAAPKTPQIQSPVEPISQQPKKRNSF